MEKAAVMTLSVMITGQELVKLLWEYAGRLLQQQRGAPFGPHRLGSHVRQPMNPGR